MPKHVSKLEEIAIYKLIEPVITQYEDGHVEYMNGHSDESIYRSFIQTNPETAMTIQRISRYRVEVFGKLKPYSYFEHTPNRINTLEEITQKLIEWASKRPIDPFKL